MALYSSAGTSMLAFTFNRESASATVKSLASKNQISEVN